MRPPYGNPGQDESIRNINDPRNPDPTTSLPARSSMQAFAQETASFSAPERYPDLFPPPAPKFNPQIHVGESARSRDYQPAPYERMKNAAVPHEAYGSFAGAAAMPFGTFRAAPEAAVPVRRPARVPAGYMPYTQTTNMKESAPTAPRNVPRRTVAPINDIDESRYGFAVSAGAVANTQGAFAQPAYAAASAAGDAIFAEDQIEFSGTGLGSISRNVDPQKDPFMKNLKYGEYLIVPQGDKAIFADRDGKPSKLPLFMVATLGILFVILLIVWAFSF